MPTYVYECSKCEHRFELFHAMSDDTPRRCPRCRSKARRVPAGGAGLLFKGSGFYVTDYRSSSYKEKAKQEGPASSGGEKGGGEKGGKAKAKDKGGGTGGASSAASSAG